MNKISLSQLKRMTGKQLTAQIPLSITYNNKPTFTVDAYRTEPVPTPAPVNSSILYKAPQQIDNFVNQYPELKVIAEQPQAVWLGEWTGDVNLAVKTICDKAKSLNQIPQFVSYMIPNRDDGGYSKGGANDPDKYRAWIDSFAHGITYPSIIILEPDAIAQSVDPTRIELIKYAANKLMMNGSGVYIDAGHPDWQPAEEMANRLHICNVKLASGFAVNTSNFVEMERCLAYGEDIATRLSHLGDGEKGFVIDTSRNGNGSNGQWCNPVGRKIGLTPSINSIGEHCDANLWAKAIGESDGNCNGYGNAGVFEPNLALELIRG